MISILDSLRPVIENAKSVKINEEAMYKFCEGLSESNFTAPQLPFYEVPEAMNREEICALTMVFNRMNFCFWGEPKWKTLIDGVEYGGSEGTLKALLHSWKQGLNILDPQVLKNLSEAELQQIFHGNTTIPMFQERLVLLREIGQIVLEKFDGKFFNVIDRADKNAVQLLEILVNDFGSVFNDVAEYHGKPVSFFKLAQLIPTDLYIRGLHQTDVFITEGIEEMTALADYKIPMVLREFGILEYMPELSAQVDNKIEILAGTDEEIEIRASMIWAIEKMKIYLQKKFPFVTAQQVSDIFWTRRREVEKNARPHHRTRTVFY